ALADAVPRVGLRRLVPRSAVDVHDASAATGQHHRENGMTDQDGSAHVHLDHPPGVLDVGVEEGPLHRLDHAGVVHQQVDAVETADDGVDGAGHVVAVGHVGADADRHDVVAPALRDYGVEPLLITGQQAHAHAALGQADRQFSADAAAGAGDQSRVPGRLRHQLPRRTAPVRSAAAATAASRAADASSAVNVRSGARNRSAYASDRRPSPIWAPVYTSNSRTDSSSSPAPARSAASTSAAGTAASTTSATSWVATGYVDTDGAGTGSSTPRATLPNRSRSISIATVRGGRPKAATTRGCSSPAWPTIRSPTNNAAQRPGCHGAWSSLRTCTSRSEGHTSEL